MRVVASEGSCDGVVHAIPVGCSFTTILTISIIPTSSVTAGAEAAMRAREKRMWRGGEGTRTTLGETPSVNPRSAENGFRMHVSLISRCSTPKYIRL